MDAVIRSPSGLIADPAHYKGDALTSSPALETVDIGLALLYDECNSDRLDAMRM